MTTAAVGFDAYLKATLSLETDLTEFEDSLRSGFAETPGAVERQIERIAHVITRAYDAALLAGASASGGLDSLRIHDADLELVAKLFAAPDAERATDDALRRLRGQGFVRSYDTGTDEDDVGTADDANAGDEPEPEA